MNADRQQEVRKRFYLNNDAIWHDARFTNLQWTLNGERFGQGDIREKDMRIIQGCLEEGETFEGWNQHHGGPHQQCEQPMVRVTSTNIKRPDHVPLTDETREALRKRWGR